MKKIYVISITIVLVLALALTGCTGKQPVDSNLTDVTIILDWVPNTNHTGLYVAKNMGFFEAEGLNVDIIQPVEGGSAQLIASGQGDFGISYQEEVIYARTAGVPIVAVAAIIQHNTSGFASPAGKNIKTPVDFAGKKYGGWSSPIETAIIDALMAPYGKSSDQVEMINIGASDFFASVERDVDFTWIYYGWTGIEAELRDFDINFILLQDIDKALDFYTPVIIVEEKMIAENPELIKKFLSGVTKGYLYSIDHPKEAADLLLTAVPELSRELVIASQEYLATQYKADAPRWGEMKSSVWYDYTNWMFSKGLLEKMVDTDDAFTNEFLPR